MLRDRHSRVDESSGSKSLRPRVTVRGKLCLTLHGDRSMRAMSGWIAAFSLALSLGAGAQQQGYGRGRDAAGCSELH